MAQSLDEPAAGRRVLLVEDDRRTVESVSELLEGAGYAVTAVSDGQAALDLLASAPDETDVIVADVVMPRLDGLSFFDLLRSQHPGLCARLVWQTAHAMNRTLAEFLARTGQPVVAKPFTPDTLLAAIEQISRR